jgi:serine/threonine protein kinase
MFELKYANKFYSSCRHPNILRFYGVVLKPLMLVTEFAENGNLQQYYTKNKSLSWDMSLKFSKEIVRGLRYLHSRDPVIVHRDIKSLNILVRVTSLFPSLFYSLNHYLLFIHVICLIIKNKPCIINPNEFRLHLKCVA